MSWINRRFVTTATVAALVPLVLAGCAKDEAKPAATGTSSGGASAAPVKLIKDGTLLVCTHSGFKPFEFPEGGKIVGFDVDIADAVAKKVGAKAEIVDIPFDQITSGAAFAANKCDMGAAGMTINEKRKAAIGISDPYFESTQVLLAKKGAGFKDLAALKGKKLGVQTDTTGKEYAEKNAAANGYQMVVFEDAATLGNAVKTAKVDASINDISVMFNFAKDNPDTEVTAEFQTGEQYGLAFAKTNTALIAAANDALKAMKADGSYAKTYEKWIGTKLTTK